MWTDRRFGHDEIEYLSPREDAQLRVPDAMVRTVVFVGYKGAAGDFRYLGTGFLVAKNDGPGFGVYIVTGRHVLDQLSGSPEFGFRINLKDGTAHTLWMGARLRFEYHRDSTVDLAVLSLPDEPLATLLVKWDAKLASSTMLLRDEDIAKRVVWLGDDVFMVGLFSPLPGQGRLTPVVRMGNLAMIPDARVPTRFSRDPGIEAYLIEARSLGGLSGSPAYIFKTEMVQPIRYSGRGYILGLTHGHWELDPQDINSLSPTWTIDAKGVNLGIALVVPAQKILDVLEHDVFKDERTRRERARLAERAALADMTRPEATPQAPQDSRRDPPDEPASQA